jgi:hypothetical protein
VDPHDPDARTTKMRDGSTHLAHNGIIGVSDYHGLARLYMWWTVESPHRGGNAGGV